MGTTKKRNMVMDTAMDTAMDTGTEIMPMGTMMKRNQQDGYRRLKLFLGNPTWFKNAFLILLKILTKHAITIPLICL